MLTGIFTALPTPFLKDGSLDTAHLIKLVQAQLEAGVHGVVLLGTTAETPTLTDKEKKQILDTCVPLLKGKVQIIIGAGTNDTASTVANVKEISRYKPDAALVVTPYYNKPNPSGLIAHYKATAKVGVPLLMYHIPGRTGLKLPPHVLADLLEQVPQLVGIKECDYDMSQVTDTAVKYSRKLSYFCGNDELLLQFLSIGACGAVSAAASVLAPGFVKIYNLFNAGKTHEAFALFTQIYPLIKACYFETNPTCIKYMLYRLGFGTQTVRAPLGEISKENKAKIDELLAHTNKDFLI